MSRSCHTLRYSLHTHLVEDGSDMPAIQALVGHWNIRTTMKYTHGLNRGGKGVYSPMDRR
jgi:site-specific recombinase XerD